MNCKNFNKKLTDYTENKFNEKLNKQMKEHIDNCPDCEKLYKERLEMKSLLKELFKVPNYTSQRSEIMNQLDNKFYNKSYAKKTLYHFNRNKFRYSAVLVSITLLFFTLPIMKNTINKNIKEINFSIERGKILDRKGNELVTNNNCPSQDENKNIIANRKYSKNDFLVDVLGITDKDKKGLTGVELQYDNDLKNGKDLVLTVDSSIQYFVEKSAETALKNNKAKAVTIIVMNPKNGEILAMTNKTDHNINNISKDAKTSDEFSNPLKNKAVNDTFIPGSIFKAITASAAIEEGIIKENEQFVCNGSIKVSNKEIKCRKTVGHGNQNIEEVLKNSCNIGIIELAERLGTSKLNQYIEKFGFGQKTGIDLPYEVSGTLEKAENISNVDLAIMALGQRNKTSSIQFLAAFNALANQGEWVRPHIMKQIEIEDSKGRKVINRSYDDFSKQKVLDTNTSKVLCEYLTKVISEGGGNKAYIKGYDIAGLCGTAQKLNQDLKAYEKGKYISSFVGMAPAKDTKVTVFVSIDEPDPSNYYAGLIAAPVGKEVFQYVLDYLKK
ncbi:MAG: penicillin-binding transpeptidase domain-containing protein [Clostridium sp.]|uniref:penicillin-binding transpeptidase domain-containing protein n=1 Tax=Clostridium sp. TaxID=1506 RepID=UPI003D6C8B22